MLILSIDTSSRGCSVALHGTSGLLSNTELSAEKSSSAMLTTLIQSCVANAGYSLGEVDAIAVAKGPGSYTGLRVGVSTAKGLCYALDKPLIAINTLEAMALQISPFFPGHLLCPMLDARRMEVYAAIFDSNNAFVRDTQAVILDEQTFEDILNENKVIFFGDGSPKFQTLKANNPNAFFLKKDIQPLAKTVGELAVKAFEEGLFENLISFEPYYLKDFISPTFRKKNLLQQ